jgi:hypothetical protein
MPVWDVLRGPGHVTFRRIMQRYGGKRSQTGPLPWVSHGGYHVSGVPCPNTDGFSRMGPDSI